MQFRELRTEEVPRLLHSGDASVEEEFSKRGMDAQRVGQLRFRFCRGSIGSFVVPFVIHVCMSFFYFSK